MVNSTNDVRYCQSARIRAPTSLRQIVACSARVGSATRSKGRSGA